MIDPIVMGNSGSLTEVEYGIEAAKIEFTQTALIETEAAVYRGLVIFTPLGGQDFHATGTLITTPVFPDREGIRSHAERIVQNQDSGSIR